MKLSLALLVMSTAAYFFSFLFHLSSFWNLDEKRHRLAFALMRIGFLFSTFYLWVRLMERDTFIPIAGLSQALIFFSWSLAFVYLVLLAKAQSDSFGLILTPLLLIMTAAALFTYPMKGRILPMPIHPFFAAHIVGAFFAYASFTISFAAGVFYLIQHHELKSRHAGTFYHQLPSLEELEKLVFQPMLWGAVLLMTAVLIGFAWSKSVYGEYWIFDPKTLATLAVASAYLGIVFLRAVSFLRGKQAALLSLAAFFLVIFSFLGTRFMEGSHHFLQG